MNFRKDINGLRALAVISVVIFHFNADWLPGGFAGVDVFFVISGFLMTGIIFRGIDKNNFSIIRFYIARANRIIPALALLCLILLIFGWLYLIPLDYGALGYHIVSSLSFTSNIIYWKEAGYFDVASHDKWLLHTWSLSVEWQFYIIYPLTLIALKRLTSIKNLKTIILVGAVVSFLFCIFATYRWPEASYFLLPTRAWEMMFGGIAYLYPISMDNAKKKAVERLGLALIIGSYFLISKDNYWPGYLALFPVFGAFLVISAERDDSLIIGNFFIQKIGAWSYSIYLWHWPLVVAIYYYSLSSIFVFFGLFFSFFLGFLSYRYVEGIRFELVFSRLVHIFKCIPVYIALIVIFLGGVVFYTDGISSRFNLSLESARDFKKINKQLIMPLRSNGYCFYSFNEGVDVVDTEVGTDCYLGAKDEKPLTLLFGDSYAGHNEPFWDEIFKVNNESFQSISTNWCVPSLTDNFTGPTTHKSYQQCLLNRIYLNENMHNYNNIIFAGSWDTVLEKGQFEDVIAVIDKAAKLGANVFIMTAPYRYRKNPLPSFYKSIYFDIPLYINSKQVSDKGMSEANLRLKNISSKYGNVTFIDRTMLYTNKNTFIVDGINVPYSLDGGHISVLGSKYSAQYFMKNPSYENVMSKFDFN
jgi:peptidoglycan/LPS O-acetylase OafA/YrhL